MNLTDAIGEQITRFSVEEPEVQPSTEVRSLLEAFMALISAYLQRVDGVSEKKTSDTFGSTG